MEYITSRQKNFRELALEFYLAVATMPKEEIEGIRAFNRIFREEHENRESIRASRIELLWVLEAVKKQKIMREKRILQDQIDELNSM